MVLLSRSTERSFPSAISFVAARITLASYSLSSMTNRGVCAAIAALRVTILINTITILCISEPQIYQRILFSHAQYNPRANQDRGGGQFPAWRRFQKTAENQG